MIKDVETLLSRIGYEFKDVSLLTNALTHSSYSSEHRMEYTSNNERLEFIGDAYVDAAVGAELFRIMKDAPEGVLERSASAIIFTWEKARKQQEAATKTPSSLIHSKQ